MGKTKKLVPAGLNMVKKSDFVFIQLENMYTVTKAGAERDGVSNRPEKGCSKTGTNLYFRKYLQFSSVKKNQVNQLSGLVENTLTNILTNL